MTGAALFVAGWITLQSDVAGASGGGRDVLAALSAALGSAGSNTPTLVEIPIDRATATKHNRRAGGASATLASRRPVCVRLCDGFFFPVSASTRSDGIAGEEASCAGLCPDAPTALYFLPAGSDKIEDATSTSGQRYTALPVSLRYRTTQDSACTCHRAIAQNLPYWQDPTLRKGDAVMTAGGFVVFRGRGHSPYAREDFTALASASMPSDRRAALMAIQRVSARYARGADQPRIAEAAAPNDAKAHGANEIRFAEPRVSATN